MSNLINIAGFWLTTGKDGKTYLRGKIGSNDNGVKAFIFKNDKKEADNHPDYRLFIDKDDLAKIYSALNAYENTSNNDTNNNKDMF